jgi:hypothetical protein
MASPHRLLDRVDLTAANGLGSASGETAPFMQTNALEGMHSGAMCAKRASWRPHT